MTTEAVVTLEQLRCITLKNTESKVEPYIWPALIKIDSSTINAPGGGFVSVITLGSNATRIVIKSSMRAGETAPIPALAGIIRARFEDNTSNQQLILIVALLENDETPLDAMQAGHRAFDSELKAAFKDEFPKLFAAQGDAEEEKKINKRISDRVASKVRSAIKDKLSTLDKLGSFFGTLDNDDSIGSAVAKLAVAPAPITLSYEAKSTLPFPSAPFPTPKIEALARYEIRGQLIVAPVKIDPCATQAKAVRDAQSAVDSLEQEIQSLRDGDDGVGLSKADINKEIARIRTEDLAPATAALKRAKDALKKCRDQQG